MNRLAATVVIGCIIPSLCAGQRSLPAQIDEISTADRIAIAQITEGDNAPQSVESILNLLGSSSANRLIRIEIPKSDSRYEFWVPLRTYLSDLLIRHGSSSGLLATYRDQMDSAARLAYEKCRLSRDLSYAMQIADQYSATSSGAEILKLVYDLAIDRGMIHLARESLTRIDRRMSAGGLGSASNQIAPSVSWNMLASGITIDTEKRSALEFNLPFGVFNAPTQPVDELIARIPYCSLVDAKYQRAQRELEIIDTVGLINSQSSLRIAQLMDEHDRETDVPIEYTPLSSFPRWSCSLPQIENTYRFPISAQTPPYLPTVYNDRVFVHLADRIQAYDLDSGSPWPEAGEEIVPLFQSTSDFAQSIPPKGLPISSWPSFSMSVNEQLLTAKIGSSVTGWLPVVEQRRSTSKVICLDLQSEGKMLESFPLSLATTQFDGSEFESTPIVVEDRVYVSMIRRDQAQYTSHVICFDLRTGVPIWVSPILSNSSMIATSPVNRVSLAPIVCRDDSLYYHSDLGVVVALRIHDGSIKWLTRYPRVNRLATPESQQEPAIGMSQILLDDELLFTAPRDCNQLFALDTRTGQLIWTVDNPGDGDVRYLIDTTSEHLIASGNRLYWIDKHSGTMQRRFPDRDPGPIEVGPRGNGRPGSDDQCVYWPTSHAIYVLEKSQLQNNHAFDVKIMQKVELKNSGMVGGNLVKTRDCVILADHQRLAVFPCSK